MHTKNPRKAKTPANLTSSIFFFYNLATPTPE
jgi:hypothetical protein